MSAHPPPSLHADEERLGELAMEFRGTRDNAERQRIVDSYADVVDRLIKSGYWNEMPPPEDQLPSDKMPRAFETYWSRWQGTP
jgi:hypothetical protein